MYADYERLVLEDYRRKKSQNVLSSQLIHPTPARIKNDCVRLCGGEIQKKDEKVKKNQPLFVIEAMKMETVIAAPFDCSVQNLQLTEGSLVNTNDLVIELN